jgi:uncharacterized protein YjbI with pentapeptide repeats
MDLTGKSFSGANLREADLRGASLWAADLSNADLYKADLSEATLYNAELSGANLSTANLANANLQRTNLSRADIYNAELFRANLTDADLSGANLIDANLCESELLAANLSNANLLGADLRSAHLVETNLEGSNLDGCWVHGVSAWNLRVSMDTKQANLIVTAPGEAQITVDDIEVAQFTYLLVNNEKLRNVIETMTSKAVLILGRFTPERKPLLDAIRKKLRDLDYLPILFDFAGPRSRDPTETVSTLARLCRFIVADITDPQSIPKELEAVVPDVAVPVTPLIEKTDKPYAMFRDYWKYHWVLEPYVYNSSEDMLVSFEEKVVVPAETKFTELERARLQALGD